MKSARYKFFLENERGAVSVVEAALVYPVVILTVTSLIYLGIYISETAFLNDKARMTAVMVAKNISFTGLDELGDVYDGYDFIDGKISIAQINRAYEDNRPYRYLTGTEVDGGFADNAEKYAAGLVSRAVGTECTVDVKRNIFSREVTVEIEKKVSMPSVFEYIGLNRVHTIHASSSAVTSDPAEFVRNTDITMNISEKLGINEKLSQVRDRIGEFLKKFKAGS